MSENTYDFPFDKDELYICSLNERIYNSYKESGSVNNNGFLALTNKRVYYRGARNGLINSCIKYDTIDLESITCTKITKHTYPFLLFLGLISFLLSIYQYINSMNAEDYNFTMSTVVYSIIFCFVFIIGYYLTITRIFTIYYSGNSTSINIKGFSLDEVLRFNKQLFLAKENATKMKLQNGGNHNETSA